MYISPPPVRTVARHLFSTYFRYRQNHLAPHDCHHRAVAREIQRCVNDSDGLLGIHHLGRSLEGRRISAVVFGRGRSTVLLWSQMHGDESTATLALLDILQFIVHGRHHQRWVSTMLEKLTVIVVPLLNPDGAQRRQRYTAAGIDMNRDARAFMTPEGRILRRLHHRFKPVYAFNLHDQSLSSVGRSPHVAALSLLAPAVDDRGSLPATRRRAMKLLSLMASVLKQFAEGHLARYDDTFEPRAFGDTMQRSGTSTVLVESGHWPRDREKKFVRKLNYVGILSALYALSYGGVHKSRLEHYLKLPVNGKSLFDVVITGLVLRHPCGWRRRVDIGLLFESPRRRSRVTPQMKVVSVGDLTGCAGLWTVCGRGTPVSPALLAVDIVQPADRFFAVLKLSSVLHDILR